MTRLISTIYFTAGRESIRETSGNEVELAFFFLSAILELVGVRLLVARWSSSCSVLLRLERVVKKLWYLYILQFLCRPAISVPSCYGSEEER